MRPSRFALFLATLFLATSCTAAPAGSPAADQAADEAQIREILAAVDAAYSAEDFNAAQSYFAESVVHMPPGQAAVVGAAAVRVRDSIFSTTYDDQLSSTVEDLTVAGDVAVVRLHYTEAWTPKTGGDTTSVTGKTLLVFRRQTDGAWKITHYMWNGDGPQG